MDSKDTGYFYNYKLTLVLLGRCLRRSRNVKTLNKNGKKTTHGVYCQGSVHVLPASVWPLG